MSMLAMLKPLIGQYLAGVKIHFDLPGQAVILRKDDFEKSYSFSEIEDMINNGNFEILDI